MSQNKKIFLQYKNSDIFNLNNQPSSLRNPQIRKTNFDESYKTTKDNIFPVSIKDKRRVQKSPNEQFLKYKNSDIFNISNKTNLSKPSSRPNLTKSTCFDFIRDKNSNNDEMKEYYSQHRATAKKYNPDKYFNNEDPAERKYNLLYDRKRDILSNKNDLSYEKSKTGREQYKERKNKTQFHLNEINLSDRKKMARENEEGYKNHKFNKTKGITYTENDNDINATKNTFAEPDVYSNNSSKLTKQFQLQSNVFGDNYNKSKIINMNLNKKKKLKLIDLEKERVNLTEPTEKEDIQKNKKILNDENDTAFQRKMKDLSSKGILDSINKDKEMNLTFSKKPKKELLNGTNLEQINEVLNEIPDKVLNYSKKQKIIDNANTTALNGDIGIDDKFLNYKKYHQTILNKNNQKKEIQIKIMDKETKNNKKLNKNITDLKKHRDYNIHNFTLSYDSKDKKFDGFSEKDIKQIFSKQGIHIYDVQKKFFDNGKYNNIKFKVRENDGNKILEDNIKKVEQELDKQNIKINITKDKDKIITKKNKIII